MIDESRRRLILRLAVVAAILLAAAIFIFFRYFNLGTLSLQGQAPFTVEFLEGEQINCESSPCQIQRKAGLHDFIVLKRNYKTLLLSAKVPLLRTAIVDIQFSILPSLTQANQLPEIPQSKVYTLVSEENRYKLVDFNDPLKTPLAYFNNKISQPKIISSDESVLIIGTDKAYRVDLTLKKRTAIDANEFQKIQSASWSPDGQELLFTTADSAYYKLLMPDNSIKTLNLFKQSTKAQFAHNGLMFLTRQKTQELSTTDPLGFFFVELSDQEYDSGLTLGRYLPETDQYINIKHFSEISSYPKIFIAASNGRLVYFENEEGTFKISF